MNSESAQAKIRMLKLSLSCFVVGILSLLPLIGLFMAMIVISMLDLPFNRLVLEIFCGPPLIGLLFVTAAAVNSGRVRKAQRGQWNAARPYWLMGIIFGSLGAILSSGLLFFFIGKLLSSSVVYYNAVL
jgi:hypothetical protein